MNDVEIRSGFHRKRLKRQHAARGTLVLDEFGLNHGRCRADIVVINGRLVGYEIKSNRDSFGRLAEQIESYNRVFDRAYLVVGERHRASIQEHAPKWWGLILAVKGVRGGITFKTLRPAKQNDEIDPISVAQLLWRSGAAEILRRKGISPSVFRQPRAILYKYLTETLSLRELQRTVRDYLKRRRNWRCPQ